jgi:hypothetical protein
MDGYGNAVLNFIQNMQYKFVELLSLQFKESPQAVIRSSISFRYNSMKSRLAIMQARMKDVSSLVKLKNPSLLLQIQRSTTPTKSLNVSLQSKSVEKARSSPSLLATPTQRSQKRKDGSPAVE